MKKQTNLSRLHAGKLSLNKKTISNLSTSEMNGQIGGTYESIFYTQCRCTATCKGYTCNKHCGRL